MLAALQHTCLDKHEEVLLRKKKNKLHRKKGEPSIQSKQTETMTLWPTINTLDNPLRRQGSRIVFQLTINMVNKQPQ